MIRNRCGTAVALTLAVLVFVAFAGYGVGGSKDDPGRSLASERALLERHIRQELADQITEAIGQPANVDRVVCTSAGSHRFECIADVSTVDELGELETRAIPITGTCDGRSCTWHGRGL